MYVRPCPPALQPFATSYQGYDQQVPWPGRHLTAASPMLPMVINLGGVHLIDSPLNGQSRVGSFVAGIHETPGTVEADAFRGIQVDFTPIGAYRLLGGPIGELSCRTVEIEDVLGREGARLVERVGNATGWADRFEVLDDFLVSRLEKGPAPRPEVVATWDAIRLSSGTLDVSVLAGKAGWSRRHLSRAVADQLGLGPKRLARLARFQRVTQILDSSPAVSLAEVALHAGYYDQAHFSNEVRALSGRTPTELRALHHSS
jgi:AraC-like DNA-binding protein